MHGGFFAEPNQLINRCDRLHHLPVVIVQGRYDVVCPMISAWELHQAWPGSELVVIDDAGHSAFEPGILSALVAAGDRLAKL
jgi:proline iminopeptidase